MVIPTVPATEPVHLECWSPESHPGATVGMARAHCERLPDCLGFTRHLPSSLFFFIRAKAGFNHHSAVWRMDAVATSEWQTHIFQEHAKTEGMSGARFRLMQRVQVRDSELDAWKPGIVAELAPLKVWPDGWHTMCEWQYVEPLETISVGSRVEALYQSTWCTATVAGAPPKQAKNPQKAVWVVQRDNDPPGTFVETRFVRLLDRPETMNLASERSVSTDSASNPRSCAPSLPPSPSRGQFGGTSSSSPSRPKLLKQTYKAKPPAAALFRDPRAARAANVLSIITCDDGCLDNYYDLGEDSLRLQAPSDPSLKFGFRSSEAAFQALRFWWLASEFECLTSEEAVLRAQAMHDPDITYAGFGSSWRAMLVVLKAKFAPLTSCAKVLAETEDAFLVDQASVRGRRNSLGQELTVGTSGEECLNWIGLQLMLIRDALTGQREWTIYLAALVDPESGMARSPGAARKWEEVVRNAVAARQWAAALRTAVEASP